MRRGRPELAFTNLIAEPDASEEAVTEAVNDTLKAIAASLLMEQVLAPRFNFAPKTPDERSGRTASTTVRKGTTLTSAMSDSRNRPGNSRSKSRGLSSPRARRRRASAGTI